jgi:hypothetical protein
MDKEKKYIHTQIKEFIRHSNDEFLSLDLNYFFLKK